jgi:hypothetical protein
MTHRSRSKAARPPARSGGTDIHSAELPPPGLYGGSVFPLGAQPSTAAANTNHALRGDLCGVPK